MKESFFPPYTRELDPCINVRLIAKKKKVNLLMGTKFEQLLDLISYFIFFLLIFFKLF